MHEWPWPLARMAELANIVTSVRDELRQDALAVEIRGATLRALWRHRPIMRRHAIPDAAIDVSVAEYPRQALVDQLVDAEVRASALATEPGSPARVALLAEKAELADRQAVSSSRGAAVQRCGQVYGTKGRNPGHART